MGRFQMCAARLAAVASTAGLFGVAAVVLPGLAGAQVAASSVTAKDFSFTPASVPIAPGGTVTFSYPAGASAHDVHFSGAQPSCTGSTATVGGASPTVSGPGWSATCTFNTPGTYMFLCDDHPGAMSGAIVVAAAATTTPPAATPPPAAAAPPTTPATAPTTGAAASGLLVAASSATAARATLTIARNGSRLAASLTGAGANGTLGRLTLRKLRAGARHISIGLDARGRRLLAARHRLSLTLTVKVTSPGGGAPTTLRRSVVFTAQGSGPGVAGLKPTAPAPTAALPPAAGAPPAVPPPGVTPTPDAGGHGRGEAGG